MRGGTRAAGIGREIEQDHRHFPGALFLTPQVHQLADPVGQHVNALFMGAHGIGCVGDLVAATTEDQGARCAIQFGNGHHHSRLDGHQPEGRLGPGLKALELQCLHRQVRHVQGFKQRLGRIRVVVCRPPNQGKAGQRYHGIDDGPVAFHKKALHRRPGIQTTGESWNDPEPTVFQGLDDCIVMATVARQSIRAHQQQANCPPCFACRRPGVGQGIQFGTDTRVDTGVVNPDLRVVDGCPGFRELPQ